VRIAARLEADLNEVLIRSADGLLQRFTVASTSSGS